ncbi:MAG: hypothetical protein KGZ71_07325 [Desulfobulbaceae bacterium]|nr:hypothetical protein [Desulfobulbaceae bacterium]
MLPIPSEPANIPTIRKMSKDGIPNLPDDLLAKILMNSKIEPINNIFSGLNVISILNIAIII